MVNDVRNDMPLRQRRMRMTWRRAFTTAAIFAVVAAVSSVSVESIITRDDDAAAATAFSAAPAFPPSTGSTTASSSSGVASPSSKAPSARTPVATTSGAPAHAVRSPAADAAAATSGTATSAGNDKRSTAASVASSSDESPEQHTKQVDSALAASASTSPSTAATSEHAASDSGATATVTSTKASSSPSAAAPVSASTPGRSFTLQVTEVVKEEGRSVSGAKIRSDYLDNDNDDDSDEDYDGIDLPSSLFEIEDDSDSRSHGRRQNYASLDAGATILDSSPETKSPTNLLVPDKDRYMLQPCERSRKWVVVSLSEDVHADAIALANFEKYSSPFKEFLVLGSVTYPTDTWFVLGNFTAASAPGEQVFALDAQFHVRYIKLRFFSHYGSEYYCTLSQLKVFGRTFTQVISQLEKSIDAEAAALEAVVALPTPSNSKAPGGQRRSDDAAATTAADSNGPEASTDGRNPSDKESMLDNSDTSERKEDTDNASNQQCPVVVTAPHASDATALLNDAQRAHIESKQSRCSVDDNAATRATNAAPATAALDTSSSNNKPTQRPPLSTESVHEQRDASSKNTRDAATLAADATTETRVNGTAASRVDRATTDAPTRANATLAPTKPTKTLAPVTTTSSNSNSNSNRESAASTQKPGRLESIFVRITKKIQSLEHNQSALGRQLDDVQTQQRIAAETLQTTHETFTTQLKEMRSLLTELQRSVQTDRAATDASLQRSNQLLEQVQRENIALWNEMLIVREVITTMKAGILCAIVLSAVTIAFYLLRLLFRCVAACKQRADLREWFWRMENEAASSNLDALAAAASPLTAAAARRASLPGGQVPATSPGSDVGTGAGSLRVNRKQQFGTSWDDSAIERKTLMSDMLVDDGSTQHVKMRRPHRSKKARTASLTYGPTIQRIVK